MEARCALAIAASLGTLALLTGCGTHPAAQIRAATGGASQGRSATIAARIETLHLQGWRTDFARHAVALDQFQDGGPRRDGIPPIDHPRITTIAGGDRFLNPREPVLVVGAGGEVRAYPERILVWHEIVNDTLGADSIAVTYCPLCNSAIAFNRHVGARTLTFGTTGKLRDSDLVMWDRQTQSWWQQFTGTALVGALTGTQLRALDTQVLSWAMFKAAYPHGTVLSQDTGFERPYGANPYVSYDHEPPAFFGGREDARLPPKERVVAVFGFGETVVVPFSRLRRAPVMEGRAGHTSFVILYARGVASALDARQIADSADVGTAGVFEPQLAARALTLHPAEGGGFVDAQTGSRWDLTGAALAGPLRGNRLRSVRHDEQYWFALAAFLPGARLLR
jgi:hypothetical protein